MRQSQQIVTQAQVERLVGIRGLGRQTVTNPPNELFERVEWCVDRHVLEPGTGPSPALERAVFDEKENVNAPGGSGPTRQGRGALAALLHECSPVVAGTRGASHHRCSPVEKPPGEIQ